MVAIARLPKAGLGNKLFPWAQAVVFSSVNSCEWLARGWVQLHVGPILRGEKKLRFYRGYFRNPGARRFLRLLHAEARYRKVRLGAEDCDRAMAGEGTAFVFDQMPHWSDYSGRLRGHRELIRRELWRYVQPQLVERIRRMPRPCIGVHVRMGDFRPLRLGEDFSKVGAVRTPFAYFRDLVGRLRSEAGQCLPVTVFSDGRAHELREILSMPEVSLAPDDIDIVHMMLLSRSSVIIPSAGSTFSHWAGFLSDAVVLTHPDHTHSPIRDAATNSIWYEGPLPPTASDWSPILLRNLRELGQGTQTG